MVPNGQIPWRRTRCPGRLVPPRRPASPCPPSASARSSGPRRSPGGRPGRRGRRAQVEALGQQACRGGLDHQALAVLVIGRAQPGKADRSTGSGRGGAATGRRPQSRRRSSAAAVGVADDGRHQSGVAAVDPDLQLKVLDHRPRRGVTAAGCPEPGPGIARAAAAITSTAASIARERRIDRTRVGVGDETQPGRGLKGPVGQVIFEPGRA
jgi:hypothetical protein